MHRKQLQTYFEQVKRSSWFAKQYQGVDHYHNAYPVDKCRLREALVQHFDLNQEERGVYLVRSGGSTEKPLVYPVDIKENLRQRDLLAKELVTAGIFTPKTIFLNLFSYQKMYRTAAILDDILERCGATTLSLSSSADDELICQVADSYRPTMVAGTPSRLTQLANYLNDNQLTLRIDHLMFGGEFLLPSQQRLFEKAFDVTKIYSLYGSAETGIWAWSDHSSHPGLFHFLADIAIEIEQADERGDGQIMVTNLIRKRFPVFRYLVGDVGRLTTVNGRPALALKSRERKSFSVDAEAYFLHDFEPVLSAFDAFQIQLSTVESGVTKLTFYLVKPDVPEDVAKDMLDNVVTHACAVISPDSACSSARSAANPIVRARLVDHVDLSQCKTTSKTPAIVDLRC